MAGLGKGLAEDSIRCRLEELVQIGEDECWLLSMDYVLLRPQMILGFGWYGIVAGRTLLGMPIAVKVPKLPPNGDDIKC